jgi:hypothetical protein
MDSPSTGAGSAFISKLRSLVVHMEHIFTTRAFHARAWRRPTLESVKTIISVSLDLVRTAVAVAVASKAWGIAAA